MSTLMPDRLLSVVTHTKLTIALFALLLLAGSGIFLTACSPSGGLKGTVASVDLVASSFVLTPPQNSAGVTSVTVTVSPQTEFRGILHSLSDLKAGMAVNVQGTANTSSHVLVASEVEDEANDQGNDHSTAAAGDQHDAAELKGTVGSIDSAHSSFTLLFSDGTSKTVTVSAQTEFEGSLRGPADLAKGERVEVKGAAQSDGTFAASSVQGENENHDNETNDANPLELTGTITSLDMAHSSFVLTQADKSTKTIVTNGQTEFDGGFNGFAELKPGIVVEVRGTAQTDGSLLASRVHREDSGGDGTTGGSDGHDGSGSGSGSSGTGTGDASGDGHGGSGSGGGSGNGSGNGG